LQRLQLSAFCTSARGAAIGPLRVEAQDDQMSSMLNDKGVTGNTSLNTVRLRTATRSSSCVSLPGLFNRVRRCCVAVQPKAEIDDSGRGSIWPAIALGEVENRIHSATRRILRDLQFCRFYIVSPRRSSLALFTQHTKSRLFNVLGDVAPEHWTQKCKGALRTSESGIAGFWE
jgi:hypothetical protein